MTQESQDPLRDHWGVFEVDQSFLEIERVDMPEPEDGMDQAIEPAFADDREAAGYVLERACREADPEAREAVRSLVEDWGRPQGVRRMVAASMAHITFEDCKRFVEGLQTVAFPHVIEDEYGFALVLSEDKAGEVQAFRDCGMSDGAIRLLEHAQAMFLLCSARYDQEVRIECKWQQAAGSVDEKLPFALLNAIDALPESEVIILIDGDGFRAGAKEWIREAAESRRFIPDDKAEKNIRVLSATEFLTWANTTFR